MHLAVVNDITELREAEQRASAAAAQTRAVTQSDAAGASAARTEPYDSASPCAADGTGNKENG